jgi:hypothetical protein
MTKDFYNYVVYDDGRVFSNYSRKFLKPDIVFGYLKYSLSTPQGVLRIAAHQLVGQLFISNPNNYPFINHIDGNKQNNHVSNLEWCTAKMNNKHARDTGLNNISLSNSNRWKDNKFREKTSKAISAGLIRNGCNKNERNPKFKYQIFLGNTPISRKDLTEKLAISQSWCDVLIKRSANGVIVPLFDKNNITVIIYKKGQQTIEKTEKSGTE